jgi:hypothetical protein
MLDSPNLAYRSRLLSKRRSTLGSPLVLLTTALETKLAVAQYNYGHETTA